MSKGTNSRDSGNPAERARMKFGRGQKTPASEQKKLDTQTSDNEDIQAPNQEDTPTTEPENVQTSPIQDAQIIRHEDDKTTGKSDVETLDGFDVQTSTRSLCVDVSVSPEQTAPSPEDVQMQKPQVPQTSRRSRAQESRISDTQGQRRKDGKTTNSPTTQTPEEQDVREYRRYYTPRDPQREKGRQTVYLDPELRRWIKHHAIDEDKDISDIILIAVREYRMRVEQETKK